MNESLTKIMWLEEDLFIRNEFIEKAKEYELELCPYNCWEDALNVLKSDLKKYSAIILNPKCKLGRGDRPKPQKFLPQVFCDITAITVMNNIIIPWYVFTDLEPSKFEDLIISDRIKYDGEWERPYYSMSEDGDYLFNRIKMQTSSIERTKIRDGVHKKFFDNLSQLTSFEFVKEDISTMEDVLISLYENKESRRCNFINLRKVIESFFKSMMRFHIIPDDLRNAMGEINITGCGRLLAGMKCTVGNFQYEKEEEVLDSIASNNLYNIINICHGYAHSESINSLYKRKDTNKYLEVTRTNNLLHACALMLVDVILEYCEYLSKNLSNIENKIFWTKNEV